MHYYTEVKVKVLVALSCPTETYGLWAASLLCPWNSPGKDTGVGCHSLLQGIYLTQGSNRGLLHCRQILYCLSHWGSPLYGKINIISESAVIIPSIIIQVPVLTGYLNAISHMGPLPVRQVHLLWALVYACLHLPSILSNI